MNTQTQVENVYKKHNPFNPHLQVGNEGVSNFLASVQGISWA